MRRFDLTTFRGSLAMAIVAAGAGLAQAVDLSVSGIEVTQAIQHYDPANPSDPDNNSIPLVWRRPTVARVYVEVTGSSTDVANVMATLYVYEGGSLEETLSADYPGLITAPLTPDRNKENHTLNFTLPDSISSDMDLVVVVDPLDFIDETDESNNIFELSDLDFDCRVAPEVQYTVVYYDASDEPDEDTIGLPDSDLYAPGVGDQFYFGAFPIPEDRSRYHAGPTWLYWDDNVETSLDELGVTLELMRQSIDPVPDYLYAWFRGNPYSNNGTAFDIPNNVAMGNTQDSPDSQNRFQRTFAHELGHCFGQIHDKSYLDPEVGYDVGDRVGMGNVKPDSLRDIMWQGQITEDAWIYSTTYEELLDLPILDCGTPSASLIDRTVLGGFIDINNFGFLEYAFEWKTVTHIDPEIFVGEWEIEIIGPFGLPVYQTFFDVHGESDSEEPYTGPLPFALTTPFFPNSDSIRLLRQGQLMDEIVRSPNKPVITILTPQPGEILAGPTPINWTATDEDGDPLTFIVQYSPALMPAPRRFVPLEVGLSDPTVLFDPNQVPGSDGPTGLIRVIASDGLNTTIASVGGLNVPIQKAPEAYLVHPKDGAQFAIGSMVTLRANAYDPEDTEMPDAAVIWTSSLDGFLGTGLVLQTPGLSEGNHEITMTVTDSDGLVSEKQVSLEVVAPALTPTCDDRFCDANGACSIDDLSNTSLGNAALSLAADCSLLVDELGSSGQDGVSVDIRSANLGTTDANTPGLFEMKLDVSIPADGSLRTIASGTLADSGDQYLGALELIRRASDEDNVGKFELIPDFAPIGAASLNIKIFNGDVIIIDCPGAPTSGPPILIEPDPESKEKERDPDDPTGCGKTASSESSSPEGGSRGGDPDPILCFVMEWDHPVLFTLPGGACPAVTGTEIRVLAENFTAGPLELLTTFDVTASGPESFLVTDENVVHFDLPGCEGDANGDGTRDPLDAGFVQARFGCPVGTGDPECDAADVNDDGEADPLDAGYVLARFGDCEE